MIKIKFTFLVLLIYSGAAQTQTINVPGPPGSGQFGEYTVVLKNGNYVIGDPLYDDGATANVGAVYLYNGNTHSLISTLKGSSANDQIGGGAIVDPIVGLENGNFLVKSLNWDNGAATDAGAVTWVNGITGLSGVVSSSNSLVGSTVNDRVGEIVLLNNSNYLVVSSVWDNGVVTDAGSVSWCNGNTGLTGTISSSSSLVGSSANDHVGIVKILSNGNYLVESVDWDNGAVINAGAVTWANGATGISGSISSSNSLVGNTADNLTGTGGVLELSNGNYVVRSRNWDNDALTDAGAVTWGNGAAGITGIVSNSNSLVGSKSNDLVGEYVIPLSNGNYVVGHPFWDNGSILDAGAVTLCNGAAGTVGAVNNINSLVGNAMNMHVGSNIVPLSNSNYVVGNRAIGTVTWGNGSTGITGVIDSSNSLYGHFNGTITPLSNGNYVVSGPGSMSYGAVTWCDGATSTTGVVDSSNSLVGEGVGEIVVPLNNGNYVVCSGSWDNGLAVDAGAVTWGDGTRGISGLINSSNSLVGKANDQIGYYGAIALPNGNYLVSSPMWANGTNIYAGAVTWGNGSTGITGLVTSSNSLVGSTAFDQIGIADPSQGAAIIILSNSNYLVASSHWQGMGSATGAVTWGNGATGASGHVSSINSLVGSVSQDDVGMGTIKALNNGNYLVASWGWNNGEIVDAGAITWADGAMGITGQISINNSLVGSASYDVLGDNSLTELDNNGYVIKSGVWDNGTIVDAGAVTWVHEGTMITGYITSCNSVMGTVSSGGSMNFKFNPIHDYLLVGRPAENIISIFKPTAMTAAVHLDSTSTNITGNSPTALMSNSECRIIATITPNGAHPLKGAVNATIWIEDTVPVFKDHPFVARHYEITPMGNTSIATSRVTLYFTQQEFNDFNSYADSTLKLPTGQEDTAGIAHLKVGNYHGTSSDRSGLPATYPDSIGGVIDPEDNDIVWNSSLNRWEISFDVTGFSGFTVHTYMPSPPPPLPLTLLEFSGRLINNNGVLSWKTTEEINSYSFVIERSTDGRIFAAIGTVAAINAPGIHQYSYIDMEIISLKVPVLYYRLTLKDIDGRFTYSKIAVIPVGNSLNLMFYPNPVTDKANLIVMTDRTEYLQAKIIDNNGRLISHQQWHVRAGTTSLPVNVSSLAKGIYYLELQGERENKRIPFVKM